MCYSAGSLDQSLSPCPMCKVFAPPPNQGCPHKREKCTNRVAHPRMDVYFLTNAEVERFNGCGYCKWANYNASLGKSMGYSSNRGWPGCCRAPTPSEHHMIELVEWAAVSAAHRVPIPPDVEKLLDTFRLPTVFKIPVGATGRTPLTLSKATTPTRRNTTSTPPRSTILSTKGMNIPNPIQTSPVSPSDRARGSSHHASGTHSANISRNSSSTAISSAVLQGVYSGDGSRRKSGVAVSSPDRRADSRDSSIASSMRRSFDIENPPSTSGSRRTSSARRPAVTPATTSVSVSKVVVDSKSTSVTDAPMRRRSSSAAPGPAAPASSPLPIVKTDPLPPIPVEPAVAATVVPAPAAIPASTTTSPTTTATTNISAKATTNSPPKTTTNSPPKPTMNSHPRTGTNSSPPKTPSPPSSRAGRDSLLIPRTRPDLGEEPIASSSSGSSDGVGSMSDSTVTSDGGFTDYLSDESEAELQRQAEARAVVQAQHEAEEREFKLARQQLATVGLKPPKLWNPNNTPPASPALPSTRPQVIVGRMSAHKQPASFGGAAVSIMQQPEARV